MFFRTNPSDLRALCYIAYGLRLERGVGGESPVDVVSSRRQVTYFPVPSRCFPRVVQLRFPRLSFNELLSRAMSNYLGGTRVQEPSSAPPSRSRGTIIGLYHRYVQEGSQTRLVGRMGNLVYLPFECGRGTHGKEGVGA